MESDTNLNFTPIFASNSTALQQPLKDDQFTYNASTNRLTAGNFCLSSDERLKSNIEPLTGCLDKVKAMRGVSYHKDGLDQVGLIAQEVQKVVPEVIGEDGKGYLSVAYPNLVGVLIEAVKELSAQVEELKNGTSK